MTTDTGLTMPKAGRAAAQAQTTTERARKPEGRTSKANQAQTTPDRTRSAARRPDEQRGSQRGELERETEQASHAEGARSCEVPEPSGRVELPCEPYESPLVPDTTRHEDAPSWRRRIPMVAREEPR
jgi:hypothetical protein